MPSSSYIYLTRGNSTTTRDTIHTSHVTFESEVIGFAPGFMTQTQDIDEFSTQFTLNIQLGIIIHHKLAFVSSQFHNERLEILIYTCILLRGYIFYSSGEQQILHNESSESVGSFYEEVKFLCQRNDGQWNL